MNATTIAVDLAKTVYACAQEWEPWLDRVAVRGEVVPFWLKPGEAAVTLGPGGSGGRRTGYQRS